MVDLILSTGTGMAGTDVKRYILSRRISMLLIESESEELRQLEEAIEKSKRLEKWQIPLAVLAILLLLFLAYSFIYGT